MHVMVSRSHCSCQVRAAFWPQKASRPDLHHEEGLHRVHFRCCARSQCLSLCYHKRWLILFAGQQLCKSIQLQNDSFFFSLLLLKH